MSTILAIDAAWTSHEPSGVTVINGTGNSWECMGLAPNYESFYQLVDGVQVDWCYGTFKGSPPEPMGLLKTAKRLSVNGIIDLVVVDMPVSTEEITGRRDADDAISKAFGGRGCSTHTPNTNRPGPIGRAMSTGFRDLGYPIATADTQISAVKNLVETYPHPALLTLLAAPYRIPYKVSKSAKYWRDTPIPQRIDNLLKEFRKILDALRNKISNIPLALPADGEVYQLSQLKRYEEALDALVCAWVGIECFRGRVRPYGDETAAIWVP